jgi:DNA polymerase-3 subunit epsilon
MIGGTSLAASEQSQNRRIVVLDTETTGLNPSDGHRIVEIACIELLNLVPTGRELHFYCNPERDMPPEAEAVHGLTREFLAEHPRFAEQLGRFLDFMNGAEALVAHNAEFDVGFLNAELRAAGAASLGCAVIDTLALARRKFPGAPASLDALCRRFGIDLKDRVKHGALIDTRLLARVYLELMGGLQPDLGLTPVAATREQAAIVARRLARPPRPHQASEAERAAHRAMVADIKEALWLGA